MKPLRIGTKVTFSTHLSVGAVFQARVVDIKQTHPLEHTTGGFGICARLKYGRPRLFTIEYPANEGITWCRGWFGPVVDAFKAAATMANASTVRPATTVSSWLVNLKNPLK